jgi:hypothetical protein
VATYDAGPPASLPRCATPLIDPSPGENPGGARVRDPLPWPTPPVQGVVGRTERRHAARPLRPVHMVITSSRPDGHQPAPMLARMHLVDVDLIARPTTLRRESRAGMTRAGSRTDASGRGTAASAATGQPRTPRRSGRAHSADQVSDRSAGEPPHCVDHDEARWLILAASTASIGQSKFASWRPIRTVVQGGGAVRHGRRTTGLRARVGR